MPAPSQPVLSSRTAPLPPEVGRIDSVQFTVGGMACGACAARVEKALRAAPGVVDAGVNFATARARVAFDAGQTDTGRSPCSSTLSATRPP